MEIDCRRAYKYGHTSKKGNWRKQKHVQGEQLCVYSTLLGLLAYAYGCSGLSHITCKMNEVANMHKIR